MSNKMNVLTKEAFAHALEILEEALNLKKDLSPTKKTVTLSASKWTDGITPSDPYYYTLTISELSGKTNVELNISETLSDADYYKQMKELELAEICRIKQNDTTLTLVCYGQKPTMDITIDILIQ